MSFSPSAFDAMLRCPWRGNVRELQHVIERAVLLNKTDVIDDIDVPADASWSRKKESSVTLPQGTPSREVSDSILSIEDMCDRLIESIMEGELELTTDVIDEIESTIVLSALRKTNGNKQAAARLLGMYRPRLYGIIKRHSL